MKIGIISRSDLNNKLFWSGVPSNIYSSLKKNYLPKDYNNDAINHDVTGLICDGNDLDNIYSSLNSMIENKKYLELGKNAKEYVSKFYWDKILSEYKKILNFKKRGIYGIFIHREEESKTQF